ncbi:hypothetical protein DS885_03855 [Psychromonas sp. B3M02]|uniref:hypothetical protein n=1 Tax=Psychromonas sp. B3M02 TaxID=2267226 RepID=UPI000DE9FDC5|nr:hypothetical protein [Psychromonas sp. B3M02]RBW47291.1 hypothetical protein DS885_03855 [Psychromonas sp. B3M02]
MDYISLVIREIVEDYQKINNEKALHFINSNPDLKLVSSGKIKPQISFIYDFCKALSIVPSAFFLKVEKSKRAWMEGLADQEIELLEEYKLTDPFNVLREINNSGIKILDNRFTDDLMLEICIRLNVDIYIDFK